MDKVPSNVIPLQAFNNEKDDGAQKPCHPLFVLHVQVHANTSSATMFGYATCSS